jgi:hypothetical protein
VWVAVGYRGELFVKTERNVARSGRGSETLFPSEADVELIREEDDRS